MLHYTGNPKPVLCDRRGETEAEPPLGVPGHKEPFPPIQAPPPPRPLPAAPAVSNCPVLVQMSLPPSSLFSLELLILLPAKLGPPKVCLKNIKQIASLLCLPPSGITQLAHPAPSLPSSLPLALLPFLATPASEAGPASGSLPLLFLFPGPFLPDLPGVGASLIFQIQLGVTSSEGALLLDLPAISSLKVP